MQNREDLTEEQLQEELREKAYRFRSVSSLVLQEMEKSDWSKVTNHEKNTLHRKNKRDKEQFTGRKLPDPAVVLPKFFDSPEVKVNLLDRIPWVIMGLYGTSWNIMGHLHLSPSILNKSSSSGNKQ